MPNSAFHYYRSCTNREEYFSESLLYCIGNRKKVSLTSRPFARLTCSICRKKFDNISTPYSEQHVNVHYDNTSHSIYYYSTGVTTEYVKCSCCDEYDITKLGYYKYTSTTAIILCKSCKDIQSSFDDYKDYYNCANNYIAFYKYCPKPSTQYTYDYNIYPSFTTNSFKSDSESESEPV